MPAKVPVSDAEAAASDAAKPGAVKNVVAMARPTILVIRFKNGNSVSARLTAACLRLRPGCAALNSIERASILIRICGATSVAFHALMRVVGETQRAIPQLMKRVPICCRGHLSTRGGMAAMPLACRVMRIVS